MASFEKNRAMSVVTWVRPNVAVTRRSGTIQMASHNAAVLSVWASGTAAAGGGGGCCAGLAECTAKPARAAAAITSGKGAAKKKMATKANTAMTTSYAPRSARRATRSRASMTITRTAALMPMNAASTIGTWPKYAYKMLKPRTTKAPGSTKRSPAASPPSVPCSRQPT